MLYKVKLTVKKGTALLYCTFCFASRRNGNIITIHIFSVLTAFLFRTIFELKHVFHLLLYLAQFYQLLLSDDEQSLVLL